MNLFCLSNTKRGSPILDAFKCFYFSFQPSDWVHIYWNLLQFVFVLAYTCFWNILCFFHRLSDILLVFKFFLITSILFGVCVLHMQICLPFLWWNLSLVALSGSENSSILYQAHGLFGAQMSCFYISSLSTASSGKWSSRAPELISQPQAVAPDSNGWVSRLTAYCSLGRTQKPAYGLSTFSLAGLGVPRCSTSLTSQQYKHICCIP